ncbi:MAG: PPE domain-containing protein [Gordonia sp. (in: high G+C Gram-positive bacteria)]
MTGFTGVIWDARTTERLVRDLDSGAGPQPLADAGHRWATIAREVAEIGAEYAAVLARLGTHWDSNNSPAALEHLGRLVSWFAQVAADAAVNASHAQAQAAATSVARLAMPHAAEVDLAAALRDMAMSVSALAPAISGAAAHAERVVHDQRLRAAQVMAAYEQATEPHALAWHASRPSPILVSDAALSAELDARDHANTVAAQRTTTLSPTGVPPTVMSPETMRPTGVPPVGSLGLRAGDRAAFAPVVLASGPRELPVVAHTEAPVMPAAPPVVAPPAHPGAALADRVVIRQASAGTDLGHPDLGRPDLLPPSPDHSVGVIEEYPVHRRDQITEEGSPTIDPAYLEQVLRLGETGSR